MAIMQVTFRKNIDKCAWLIIILNSVVFLNLCESFVALRGHGTCSVLSLSCKIAIVRRAINKEYVDFIVARELLDFCPWAGKLIMGPSHAVLLQLKRAYEEKLILNERCACKSGDFRR